MGRGGHRNNFDFLRVLAAFLVIYGHGLAIRGLPLQNLWGAQIDLFGVCIFFSISGYLVTDSWLRTPALPVFVWKRFLRIWPALFVVVVLTTFVFGPLVTRIPLSVITLARRRLGRISAMLLSFSVPGLPGVFDAPPLAGLVNGPLWSLPVEVACYATVPLSCLLPPKIRVPLLCARGRCAWATCARMFDAKYITILPGH